MLSKYDDGTWRNAVTPVLDAVKPPFIREDVEVMTIPQITKAAAGWSREEIEAALEQERSGKARKGALAALESALEEKD